MNNKEFFLIKTLDYYRSDIVKGLRCASIVADVYDGLDRFVDEKESKIAFLNQMIDEAHATKTNIKQKVFYLQKELLKKLDAEVDNILYFQKNYEKIYASLDSK